LKKNIIHNSLTQFSCIEIFRLEELRTGEFDYYQRFDFHLLLWNTETDGNITFNIDFNDFETAGSQAVVIYPYQNIKIDLTDKKGYLFLIHNDVFFGINQKIGSDYLNGFFINQLVSLSGKNAITMRTLVDLLLEEYNSGNRTLMMESYMFSILFHVSTLFDESPAILEYLDYPVFGKLMSLIETHFITEKGAAFYIKKLNISAKKLNKICESITNKKIKYLIQDRIILEIRKELYLGKKTVKEIAYDLGFTEPSYLTRFTKKHTGLTPKEFPKQ